LTQDKIRTERLNAWYYSTHAVKDVSLPIKRNQVTAIIGPSGCGKSTLIRCMNRMHELVAGARVSGHVYLDGVDIYEPEVDPVQVRRRVGMVFQKPNPFPTMSIYDNVAAGLKLNGVKDRDFLDKRVEEALRMAALWDEVKDRLHISGASLSGGQQQRLCIARALAVEPEVLLMDEPASALDPVAAAKIEELITKLKEHLTIVVVTHNMQQAARIADFTAFMYMGELIEYGKTSILFETPQKELTERYITGRFG
jgi:phosphate transport system ATP-binding protein